MIMSNSSISSVGRTAIINKRERNFAYTGYLIRLKHSKNLLAPKYLNL
ncbi:hypothetical protein NIES4102_22420 [Chondrocystis sp. NIES-4102]|nr:hypothetical protein NIES4102_22420 [Chondrocystis sp. NIES-4102]